MSARPKRDDSPARTSISMIKEDAERRHIESLLPWYAAGTLGRSDADRVEQALAGAIELARCYALVLDERAETIYLNEMLGEPSARIRRSYSPRSMPWINVARRVRRLLRTLPSVPASPSEPIAPGFSTPKDKRSAEGSPRLLPAGSRLSQHQLCRFSIRSPDHIKPP
jgi:hypothetical protein